MCINWIPYFTACECQQVPDTVSEEGKNWFGKEVEQLSENIKSSFPPTLPQKHGKYRWEQAGSKHPSKQDYTSA